MSSCMVGKVGREEGKGVGGERVAVKNNNLGESDDMLARASIDNNTYGPRMFLDDRRRFQSRFQPRIQSRTQPKNNDKFDRNGGQIKVQVKRLEKRGGPLHDKVGRKFLVKNNPFAVLEMEGEGIESDKVSEIVVACPIGVGEMEMRLAEVRPTDEEPDDFDKEGEDELVDEEIIVEERPVQYVKTEDNGVGGDSVCEGGDALGREGSVIREGEDGLGCKGGMGASVCESRDGLGREGILIREGEVVRERGGVRENLVVGRGRPKGKLVVDKDNILKRNIQGKMMGRER